MLYQIACKINGAQFQKIVVEEFYPAITEQHLPRFQGHEPSIDPSISAVFLTAAFRIGHTLVGNVIHRVGLNSVGMSPLYMMETFLRLRTSNERVLNRTSRGCTLHGPRDR